MKLDQAGKEEERQSSEFIPTSPVRRDTFASVCTDSESDSAPAGEESKLEGEPQNGPSPPELDRQEAVNQFPGRSRNQDPSTNLVQSHRVSPRNRNRSTAFGAQAVVVDFTKSREGSLEPFIGRFAVYKLLDGMDPDFPDDGIRAGPSKLMHEAKLLQGKSLAEPNFRWIHLPSNNTFWFEVSRRKYSQVHRTNNRNKETHICGVSRAFGKIKVHQEVQS